MQGTPCRILIIRAVGKLIVSLHLTGLVRFRSHIALPKIQPVCFPPPYGLGSLSLTHRPTENPTGMTHCQNLQEILNHAPLFRMTTKATPLRDTPHPDLPQSGEGAFCRFPLNLERGVARYPPQLGEGEGGDRSFHSHSELRPGMTKFQPLPTLVLGVFICKNN